MRTSRRSATDPRGILPGRSLPGGRRWLPVCAAVLCFATLLFSTWVSTAAAQSVVSREYAIKAAYLYNFGRYVEWNSSKRDANGPFVIGVLGPDPFGSQLDKIAASKQLGGRRIEIRRFASLEDYKPCDVLFVSRGYGSAGQLEAIKRLGNSEVLLVGETPAFADEGGVIGFFIDENKIRFEINQEAAKRKGLKISSKLLHLAELVDDKGGS